MSLRATVLAATVAALLPAARATAEPRTTVTPPLEPQVPVPAGTPMLLEVTVDNPAKAQSVRLGPPKSWSARLLVGEGEAAEPVEATLRVRGRMPRLLPPGVQVSLVVGLSPEAAAAMPDGRPTLRLELTHANGTLTSEPFALWVVPAGTRVRIDAVEAVSEAALDYWDWTGQRKKAMQAAEAIHAEHPRLYPVLMRLAQLYFDNGFLEDAEAMYEEAAHAIDSPGQLTTITRNLKRVRQAKRRNKSKPRRTEAHAH